MNHRTVDALGGPWKGGTDELVGRVNKDALLPFGEERRMISTREMWDSSGAGEMVSLRFPGAVMKRDMVGASSLPPASFFLLVPCCVDAPSCSFSLFSFSRLEGMLMPTFTLVSLTLFTDSVLPRP